ncbi:MAG: CBS domain-containing protein [Saprospiraceae bacterium]|nr:CBS domain-containing protein [Saprospiraceae bacterium]
MMNEEVRTIMSKNPITASPDQTIDEVSNLMMESQMQQLPVVLGGKLVGMITSYDLWQSMRTGHVHDRKVKDVMNTKIVRITPKDKIGTAAELFADRRFKTLPVVNLENELKGVVTAFDVIKCIYKEEYPRPILYQEVFNK